jgi:hypothetical protein
MAKMLYIYDIHAITHNKTDRGEKGESEYFRCSFFRSFNSFSDRVGPGATDIYRSNEKGGG